MAVQSQTNGHFLLLPRGIVFLLPNLRRQHSSDEERRPPGSTGCPLPSQRPIWFDPLRPLAFVAIGFCICSKANQFLAKQISCRQIPCIPGLARVTLGGSHQGRPCPEDYAGESSHSVLHRRGFDYIQILFKTPLKRLQIHALSGSSQSGNLTTI